MDSVGHEATHQPTKIHREEDGKVTEKETAREHRTVEADPGNSGQTNPGKLTLAVRAGEKMTGTQQSRVLKHQQQLKHFNMLPW